jgi:uncharacterized membrane protein HdeD (DUF308 family)
MVAAAPSFWVLKQSNDSSNLLLLFPFVIAALASIACVVAFAISGLGWLRFGQELTGAAIMVARGVFTLVAYLTVPWSSHGSYLAFWTLIAISAAAAIASLLSLALRCRSALPAH